MVLSKALQSSIHQTKAFQANVQMTKITWQILDWPTALYIVQLVTTVGHPAVKSFLRQSKQQKQHTYAYSKIWKQE